MRLDSLLERRDGTIGTVVQKHAKDGLVTVRLAGGGRVLIPGRDIGARRPWQPREDRGVV